MKLNSSPLHRPKGFALIATLLLFVLLAILTVGILNLSVVTLRSSSRNSAQAEAQANARMALMLAIGELQKHTGPDTRITAPAEMIETGAPPLTGVWKSWEGTNHDSTGRPIAPDYDTETGKYTVKTESEANSGRFLSWLVSGAKSGMAPEEENNKPSDLLWTNTSGNSDPPDDYVALLDEGTLGESNLGQVHVTPQPVKDANDDTTGTFAWWVSPENQKARLIQPHEPRPNGVPGLVEMGQSHLVPDPGVFGLALFTDDPESYLPDPTDPKPAGRAISLDTTELLVASNPENPQESFHHLSTTAVGLLTNTATGGWKKDISILTEKWDQIYTNYGATLPLFRFTLEAGATATSQVPRPTTSNYDPTQSNLYPWSNYSTISGDEMPSTHHAASASWQSLVNFATSYKNFSYSASGAESPFVWDVIANDSSNLTDQQMFNYKHTQRLYPQIARFQFLIYAKAIEDPARLGQTPRRYRIRLMYVPVFTLWNPYNVGLTYDIPADPTTEALGFGWRRGLPGAMAIVTQASYPNPDLVPSNQYSLLTPGNFQYLDVPGNYSREYDTYLPGNTAKFKLTGFNRDRVEALTDMRTSMANLPSGQLAFKPGEVQVFSPNGAVYATFSAAWGLKKGYNPTNIEGYELNGSGGNLTADRAYWFLFRPDKLTQPYKNRSPGLGFALSFGRSSGPTYLNQPLHTGIQQELANLTMLAPEDIGNVYWPPTEVDEVGYTVGALASGPWIPIFSMSFGPRMSIGTAPGSTQNRPTRGVLQNNPLASIALVDPVSGNVNAHPANNPFDITYHSLSMGTTLTPNLSDSKGYIATGYQSGDGLSRIIMANLPLRPMASLVELQDWNPRGNNPFPPFQINLIGNSDATPLIPRDNIVPPTLNPSAVEFNLQHDDAYCANHLLFDDWFVSSIAPQAIGNTIAKDIQTVYEEYLMGDYKLSNRAYQPISQYGNLSSDDAKEKADEILNSPDGDGWLKVASRFEVEGMFNVNSTSVDAWKAILGHAKNRAEIALYGVSGIEPATPTNGHPVTRGAVASDVEAGSGTTAIGGEAENAAQYTGFRSLTNTDIENLAVKIVDQIQERGPFLSLSEFVNRQLSSDQDLALAGAVQAAINALETDPDPAMNDPMKDLRDPANSLSASTMPETDPKLSGVGYEFGKAAEGSSAYGAPGWIRQADILRPIAPILSARDDTFTIRAYGDARDKSGKILAKAWCEAVVKRTRNFADSSEAADSIEPPVSQANTTFGRKYQISAFRWLSPSEV